MDTHATGPDPVRVDDGAHVLSTLFERDADSNEVRLSSPVSDGWDDLTGADVVSHVRSVAAGLIAAGLAPGDRVALLSPTRWEWAVADMGILAAGGATVPIYDTASDDQIAHVIRDAEPRAAIVATERHAEVLREASGSRTSPDPIVVLDAGGLDSLANRAGHDEFDEVDRRVEQIRGDDVASLVYTSGTTGDPKGCILTHRNLVWTSRQVVHRLGDHVGPDDSTLLFLPLAHIFTRVVQFACIEAGARVGFARSIDDLPDDLRSFQPTFLLAVPRVFEKVVRSARREATGVRGVVFDLAERAGTAWSRSSRPGPHLRAARAAADRLVYTKLRAGIGGRVRFCVSGGAPLDQDLAHFFRAAGIPILEGYGLTETSAPAAVNTPEDLRIGSVGRPIPGVSIRIADDGEIQVRGESVFAGYHQLDDETASSFDDGWYRTGDLGEIDEDGYLMIGDRKKDLIVTAGGKNVSPGPLEQKVTAHRLVSNAVVIGDDRPFVALLVTLDDDERERLGLSGDPNDDGQVREAVSAAVEEANAGVSKAESIREFLVLDRDFSVEEGELTQTMKPRRATIAEHFADEIESLYASDR